MSRAYFEKLLFHAGKGLWKGIPVIGPVIDEVVFAAHQDQLIGKLEDACSGLSEEDLATLDQMLTKAEGAVQDSLAEFEGQIGVISNKVELAEANIRSDLESLKRMIQSLQATVQATPESEARQVLIRQLEELEQRRQKWIAGISSTQRLLLSIIPEAADQPANVAALRDKAAEVSSELGSSSGPEFYFRLHELRWLGLIDRRLPAGENAKSRDWHYWRTVEGSELDSGEETEG